MCEKDQINHFTETDVLEQLDLAFKGLPGKFYPNVKEQDIKYNFFLVLEDGYCEIAGNRIHLYADSSRWALVFEKSGYHNRQRAGIIELTYIGNCIEYSLDIQPDRNYISNERIIWLIEPKEFERIENRNGKSDIENFELINPATREIKIRDKMVLFENNYKKYEQVGIEIRNFENPEMLIGFGEFMRYLNEINPSVISASEDEIRKCIPKDLPKLMTINKFHYESSYDNVLPSQQETFKLAAKILVAKDTTYWRPKEKFNNHWINWKSGDM